MCVRYYGTALERIIPINQNHVSRIKPGFHIVVGVWATPQSLHRRYHWGAYIDMGPLSGHVIGVPVESTTFKWVQHFKTLLMHRRRISEDCDVPPSLMTLWKPGIQCKETILQAKLWNVIGVLTSTLSMKID